MTTREFEDFLQSFPTVLKMPRARLDNEKRATLLSALRHVASMETSLLQYERYHPFGLSHTVQPPTRAVLIRLMEEGPQGFESVDLREIFASTLAVWALRELFRNGTRHPWLDEKE